MRKKLTPGQLMFVLPLLIIVAIFSLYPIISSFAYTLFDYRTNDQQHSKLFVSSNLNAELFYEDCDYINYYLEDDITCVDASDAMEFQSIMDIVSGMMKQYEGVKGTNKISAAQTKDIETFIQDVGTKLTAVYAKHPDVKFYNKDKFPVILKEMQGCLITSNFSGLNNYKQLFADPRFGFSLVNTLIFTLISVTAELIMGLALAMIMNRAIKGIGVVRTTALIPWAIPTAVSALIWSYLYDGSSGIIAQLFAKIGLIAAPEHMLLSAGGAMFAAILADVWKTTPYMALLLLAGLQVIDKGLYESSAIDGAGKIRTFFKITLPMLKPSILVALLFRTLDAFRVYDLIAVLTGGGPGGATETLSIYAYKVMISQSNYGYGSVIVVAMFVCVALIAFLFVKVLGAELISDD